METYRGFKELECWKQARELRKRVAIITKTFPPDEKFLLTAQIKSASRSVTANIAEGYGRYSFQDTRHFFIQARGSVTEVIDHVSTAFDEGYISEAIHNEMEMLAATVFKLINGYIAWLDKSKLTGSPANSKSQTPNS